MGHHYSSDTSVGSIINMQKFLIASFLAVATLAAPEADADAYYGGLAATWPAVYGYGVQSTCYGCRGHYIGKRSADAAYGYGYTGVALHPGHATSFVARSPQGLHGFRGHYIGKRSADADAFYGYGGYGHAAGVLNNNVHGLSHFGSGYGISQLHPSGHSFQHTSRLHKREAEAEPEADAYYGYYGHGYGLGYGHGYGHGLGYHGLGYSHGGYYGRGYGHGFGYGYHG